MKKLSFFLVNPEVLLVSGNKVFHRRNTLILLCLNPPKRVILEGRNALLHGTVFFVVLFNQLLI